MAFGRRHRYSNALAASFSESNLRLSSNKFLNWLNTEAFAMWWETGADLVNGGFFEQLSLDGTGIGGPRRFRVQPRQVYSFALAKRTGWKGEAQLAQVHGLSYFLKNYRRPDGSFGSVCDDAGQMTDASFDLYNQAFALLAFASIVDTFPEQKDAMIEEATALWRMLQTLRRSDAGFEEDTPRRLPLCSNPHMHMFEACLAWENIASKNAHMWRDLSDEIARLAMTRFVDDQSGCLREFFAADWTPAPELAGRIVEPGHQFEWAWLLATWGRRRGNEHAIGVAKRLFKIGEDYGVCPMRNVVLMRLLDDFTPHDETARLWPQAEWIKSAILLAALSQGDERRKYLASAEIAVSALSRFITEVPVAGLWRDKMRADGSWVEEPAPASSLYHIVCAIVELRDRLDEIES